MEFTRFPPAFGRGVNITGLTDTWKVSAEEEETGRSSESGLAEQPGNGVMLLVRGF